MAHSRSSITPAALHGLVSEALKGATLGAAYEQALLALADRERIAIELLRDGLVASRTEALRAAGYAERSSKSPGGIFGRPRVALAMELGKRLDQAGVEVTTESFRDDLVQLARADPADAYDQDGRLLPLRSWPAALRRMIRSVKFNPIGGVESVTFEGRAQLLGLLGKHRLVGAFDEKRRETRTYIIRDYTGRSAELPASVPAAIEAELVDQVDQADAELDQGDVDQGDRSSLPKPNGVLIASEDIDRGFIPVR